MQKSLQTEKEIQVDYLFAGMGAANSLIFLTLFEKEWLNDKRIAVFEPQIKNLIDKTFCFWASENEIEKLGLASLISYKWSSIKIIDFDSQSIDPYQYYCVKGNDLYERVIATLSKTNHTFFNQSFPNKFIQNKGGFIFQTDSTTIIAAKVFDNRTPGYFPPESNESHLLQSFYGWKIKTKSVAFNSDVATLMDFSIPQNDTCQFVYVLPYAEKEALVEVTRFDKKVIVKEEAETILKKYIQEKFETNFELIEEEHGCIPMSSAKIKIDEIASNHWTNTGARANLIKPSTGYGFLNMAEDANQIAHYEIVGESKERYKRKGRFTFYDRLLLKILEKNPEKGKLIFQTFFSRIKTKDVLTFLREQSSLKEELKIFSVLPLFLFIKAAIKDSFSSLTKLPVAYLALLITVFSLFLQYVNQPILIWIVLLLGFFTIGLSHGALDHVTNEKVKTKKDLSVFIITYISKGVILGLVWYLLPDVALLAFITFSAWHFGQADFQEWKLNFGYVSFFWGFCVLGILLSFHLSETIEILSLIPKINVTQILTEISYQTLLVYQVGFLLLSFAFVAYTKNLKMLLTIINLLLLSFLPLIFSFGIYFVFQHSLQGWKHLKKELNMSSNKMWGNALPFSIAGALFILYFIIENNTANWGLFFIMLACISMPHVLSMDAFYRKRVIQSN